MKTNNSTEQIVPRSDLEQVLQGRDPIANALIGYFLARGWSSDRIIKNVAMKTYSPNRALIRVTPDLEYQQYWVRGEYFSEGGNVLSGCTACVNAAISPEEMEAEMTRFLKEVESCINQSFAVRFLSDKP